MDRRRRSDHPIWGIARLALIMAPLTVFLYSNASNFDWTEIKSILEMGLVLGGYEGVKLMRGVRKG